LAAAVDNRQKQYSIIYDLKLWKCDLPSKSLKYGLLKKSSDRVTGNVCIKLSAPKQRIFFKSFNLMGVNLHICLKSCTMQGNSPALRARRYGN